MESWRLATAEAKARPRGAVVVRAPANATVSVDGRPPQSPPVVLPDLPHGDHFVRVDEPGRRSWSVVAPLVGPTFEIDVPLQPSLALDDALATAHGRRMEAGFVLVGELKPPAPPEAQQLELRLVDAASGQRRDATSVPFPGDAAALEAAVMRLDEIGRRSLMERGGGSRVTGTRLFVEPALPAPIDAKSPVPAPDRDPEGWARRRWPLLVAVGAAVTAALVLGFVATRDR
jgi:hypothetical protein